MKNRDIKIRLNTLENRVEALEKIDYNKKTEQLEEVLRLKTENRKLRLKIKTLKDMLKELKWERNTLIERFLKASL